MDGAMRPARVAMTVGVVAACNRTQCPIIADIGGGIGTHLASILDAFSCLKKLLFR
jgi:hypothetical protein